MFIKCSECIKEKEKVKKVRHTFPFSVHTSQEHHKQPWFHTEQNHYLASLEKLLNEIPAVLNNWKNNWIRCYRLYTMWSPPTYIFPLVFSASNFFLWRGNLRVSSMPVFNVKLLVPTTTLTWSLS